MIEELPKVIIVGDIEFLFTGLALGLGSPKLARRILGTRYGGRLPVGGGGDGNDDETTQE